MGDHLSRDAKELFRKIFTFDAEKRPTAETLYNDSWISPPLSIKDKVASILGESKTSTYASSMNKVSSSNIDESDNKPKLYRKEIETNEKNIVMPIAKDMKRIGNNFRIIRSPQAKDERCANFWIYL